MDQINQEIPLIDFSANWNNKLGCDIFTVIRMRNDTLYKTGSRYRHSLKFVDLGIVEILEIKHFTLAQLTDFMSFIDMGVNRKEAIKLITEQFGTAAAEPDQEFSYILLRRKKPIIDTETTTI